jgi:signal transduction histidine kinase
MRTAISTNSSRENGCPFYHNRTGRSLVLPEHTRQPFIFVIFKPSINPVVLAHQYSILLISITLINLALAVYAIRYFKSPGAPAYSLVMTLLSIYSFGYAFELQAENLQQILFWLNFEYLGISFLPPLFIILALHYTGMGHILRMWLVIPLFLIAFTTLFLEFTNYGNLFYRELRLNANGPFVLADFLKGPWYWVHQAYANLMLLFSSILYLFMFRKTAGHNRRRAIIMLLALDIPWGFYIIYLIGRPYNIDLCPFSFSVAGILTAFGIFRYHLLDYVPLALENVLNSMTAGVVIIDQNMCLISFNKPAAEILPDLSTGMKGRSVKPVFSALPCLADLKDGFESDIEVAQHGKIRYFHMQVVAVKTEHGRLTGWAVIFTNITERKSKEIELLEIERKLKDLNASKDKIFAIIAHDLRNAFHLIINMTEMVVENLKKNDTASAKHKSKIIFETSISTYGLLQNLLDWALMQLKGMPFNRADILLNTLIQAEVKNLKAQSDQKDLTIQFASDKPLTISGDEEMLKTVLRNLLSNAIKFSHPGGTINVNAFAHEHMVTVEVSDHGTGMTEEEQDKLFKIESYLSKKGTASEIGTGLGLKLCREFISMHGGKIWVTSEPAKGSRFSFTVPAAGSITEEDMLNGNR